MERLPERQNGQIDSDVNFSDVFGGPPRRSSMYEMRQRYSYVEEEEAVPYRRTGNDFFNDIFNGNQSSGSKQQDPFSSQFSLATFGPPPRSSTPSNDPNHGLKVATDASHFHFSIYKWASKGVPLMGSNNSRSKEVGQKTNVPSRSSKENDSHGRAESSQMAVEKVISLGAGRVDNVSADTVLKLKPDSHLKVGSGGKEAGESKGVNASNKKASVETTETVKKPNALTATVVDKAAQPKVKESAQIFTQPKTAVASQSQSSSRKGTFRPEKEANPKLQFNLNMDKSLQHESISELNKSGKSYSASKTENNSNSAKPKNASVPTTVPDVAKKVVGDADESSQRNFAMRESPLEKNEIPQPGKDHEDMQAADAKIRKWSNGKEGNIRSLLSTLQYVLWAESGWKPVPLVDIIEGNAVKRAYQRALLRLHPDKLQQKGAASHQRYIAEKVFDILQEAWTQFNSMGSL